MTFILKYGSFFLFLFLEGYCLYLTAQYNKKASDVAQSTERFYSGVIYNNFSSLNKYFSISEMADSLANQNAALLTRLESVKYNNTVETGTVRFPLDTFAVSPDSPRVKLALEKFQYIAAEVIDNSIVRVDNYLTLNRGSLSGVKKDMGVISADGIVGIVRKVSPNYSLVMSLLHKQTSISAMIRRNRNFGSLIWKGGNPKHMTLEYVPKHAEVVKGDTVVTSGFSEVFPGGLRVGTVADARVDNGTNFYTIDVLLSNDLNKARYVYVVGNMGMEELRDLRSEPQPDIKIKKKRKP